MSDLILSINSKILKVTLITSKGDFEGITKEIPNNICVDSKILDSVEFSNYLGEILDGFLPKNKKNYTLNFLLEPENIYSEFIELPQSNVDDMDAIIEKAKHQLEGVDLNELYYTHSRLAPFVRHFVGVKKVVLEKYIEVAQNLKMELKSVLPWNFLLPKYTNALEPSLFVVLNDKETIFSLSEYNNVYFSKSYARKFKPQEIEDYIAELANYERTSTIKKIYLLGKENLKLEDAKYEIIKISLPNSSVEETHGYEHHLLAHYMIDFSEDLIVSPMNVLSLLPLPTTVKSPSALVYAGAAVSVLLLLGGVIYGGYRLTNSSKGPLANNPVVNPDVAGAEVVNIATTELSVPVVPSSTAPVATEQKPLVRKDLSIKIENGAGIAGLASKTKNFLTSLGYTIFDIGDADLTGRENTVLKFKKDKIAYKDLLKEDIKGKYLDVVVQDDLDTNEKFDVLLIVGTKVDDL